MMTLTLLMMAKLLYNMRLVIHIRRWDEIEFTWDANTIKVIRFLHPHSMENTFPNLLGVGGVCD